MSENAIIVLDVGKTMSKISLWRASGALLEREVRVNARCQDRGMQVLDVQGIQDWVRATLSAFSKRAQVGHIIPVAHGAAITAVKNDKLAFAPLDYESEIPSGLAAQYLLERDPFEITGSPSLSAGLNLGVQLYRMQHLDPKVLDGVTLMPWAQYWAWFLSGVARSEVTSLGCHTDLWCPHEREFSPMAKRLGWAEKFAPIAYAGEAIGEIRPSLAAATGLPRAAQIHCGLHDSNAALVAAKAFPALKTSEATVLSTGTWFVAMRSTNDSGDEKELPPNRDCLINVDAWQNPVPSSRFMGGREIETIIPGDVNQIDIASDQIDLIASIPNCIAEESMLLPSFTAGSGPFPNNRGGWLNEPSEKMARRAATCIYAALVADTSLDLIGAKNKILIEGRFAKAEGFVRTLASLRPQDSIYTASLQSDVSFGALSLVNRDIIVNGALAKVQPTEADFSKYRQLWQGKLGDPQPAG